MNSEPQLISIERMELQHLKEHDKSMTLMSISLQNDLANLRHFLNRQGIVVEKNGSTWSLKGV